MYLHPETATPHLQPLYPPLPLDISIVEFCTKIKTLYIKYVVLKIFTRKLMDKITTFSTIA
jgi:hypothetical protein